VVEGIFLTDSVWVVVVVVVGAGFSTTVVHEVRSMAATASSGIRMISFFIVGVVPSRTNRCRFFGQMYFERRFSRLKGSGDFRLQRWKENRDQLNHQHSPLAFSVWTFVVSLRGFAFSKRVAVGSAAGGSFHGD
jgi:hypothetical protein